MSNAYDMSEEDDAAFEAMKAEKPIPEAAPAPKDEPAEKAPTTESEKDATDDDLSDEEVARRADARVPLSALHEQRKRRQEAEKRERELSERLARYEEREKVLAEQREQARQPEQPRAPLDPVNQPLETLEDVFAFKQRMEQEQRQREEHAKIEENNRQFVQAFARKVEAFQKEDPDGPHFVDAYNHLYNQRLQEHLFAGVAEDRARAALLDEEAQIIDHAFRTGVDPAKRLVEFAKMRGWKPPVPEAKPEEEEDKAIKRLDRMGEARRNNASLGSAGGSATGGAMDAATLLKMPLEEMTEWGKKNPKKFDEIMGR